MKCVFFFTFMSVVNFFIKNHAPIFTNKFQYFTITHLIIKLKHWKFYWILDKYYIHVIKFRNGYVIFSQIIILCISPKLFISISILFDKIYNIDFQRFKILLKHIHILLNMLPNYPKSQLFAYNVFVLQWFFLVCIREYCVVGTLFRSHFELLKIKLMR